MPVLIGSNFHTHIRHPVKIVSEKLNWYSVCAESFEADAMVIALVCAIRRYDSI